MRMSAGVTVDENSSKLTEEGLPSRIYSVLRMPGKGLFGLDKDTGLVAASQVW